MLRKKISVLLMSTMVVVSLSACGNKAGNADASADAGTGTEAGTEEGSGSKDADTDTVDEGVSTKDYVAEDYVTIGNYEGMEVSVPVYNYSDEDVETEMNAEFEYYVNSTGASGYQVVDKDTVENGDIVNIDYVGTKDGVAFDGGTAQGYHLTIGSGQFIDGFESGLEGHKVGEKVSLNLTFPEEYHSEELAGQAVVFDVTINSIEEEKTPELNDDFVKQMGLGVNTVEEFKKNTEDYLKKQVEERNKVEKKNAVWEAVFDTCSVQDPPDDMVNDILSRIRSNLLRYAEQYNVSEEDFITQYMGTTREEYDTQCRTSAIRTAKEKLAAAAIAKKEGIEVTDETIQEYAQMDAENYGYESAEAVINETGAGAYYDYVMGQKVDEMLLTKVKINEMAPVSILSDSE